MKVKLKSKQRTSPNLQGKVKTQSFTKGALVFATFVSFICFQILFVIIKKGEIVEAT